MIQTLSVNRVILRKKRKTRPCTRSLSLNRDSVQDRKKSKKEDLSKSGAVGEPRRPRGSKTEELV
jgi:hypothetical protein